MNPSGELSDEISGLLDKAARSLAAAAGHQAHGDFDFAASRSYYAAFYAMTAVLLSKKLTFSKHTGVIGASSEHFIRSGIFPKDFGGKIARLFRERQLADYEAGLAVESEEAAENLADATAIVTAIKNYLQSTGFGSGPDSA